MNILFVCTGNTCRSPMAEGIFRAKTAEYSQFLTVASCGIAAFPGDEASENAKRAMLARGIDISAHRARRASPYIIEEADMIFCMSLSHMQTLRGQTSKPIFLLGGGVSDPYGGDEETYKKCADEIENAITQLLSGGVFFTVTPMVAEDVEFIAPLEERCFSEPWSVDSFNSQITKDYGLNFTLRYLGKPVGYLCADKVVDEIYIGSLAVDEEFRRRHCGKRLLGELMLYAAEKGFEAVTLEVRVSNIPAINLYASFGFKVEGKRKDFYRKPTEDGYIMTVRIQNQDEKED